MLDLSVTDRIEVLEEVIELMDQCAERLRSLKSDRINAYVMAEFEGREAGWMGEFARDIVQQELEAAREEAKEAAQA